jgi:hypothetical protein
MASAHIGAPIPLSPSWTQLTSGASASGTLTVKEGASSMTLTLVGSYTSGNFSVTSDGHSGTLVTDPPVPGGGAVRRHRAGQLRHRDLRRLCHPDPDDDAIQGPACLPGTSFTVRLAAPEPGSLSDRTPDGRWHDQEISILSRRSDDPRQHARRRRAVARGVVLGARPDYPGWGGEAGESGEGDA